MNKQLVIKKLRELIAEIENGDKPKRKPKHKPHNPARLTKKQIDKGWRLLDEDEIKDRQRTHQIQIWAANRWLERAVIAGCKHACTYRTKLTRKQLAKLP